MSGAGAAGRSGRAGYVVASVWHDDNKGDSAIAEGVLTLAAAAFPEGAAVAASMLAEDHQSFPTAARHLRRAFPTLKVVPSTIPKPELSAGRGRQLLAWAVRTAYALFALVTGARTALALAVRQSSIVIANGGHTLYSSRGPASLIRLVRLLYPYWLARRFGRPYLVLGQSLGPFEPGPGRWLASSVLRGAERVFVREELSRETALELGVRSDNIGVIPDPAFLLEPDASTAVQRLKDRTGLRDDEYIVITVRQAYAKKARGAVTTTYLREVARLIRRLLDEGHTTRVAIVAHCLGPVPSEDDRIPSRELFALVGGEGVVLIEDDLSPRELSALYGCASWVVGTRFHSVILAAVAGTPPLAISYFGPKTRGIMKMLGLEPLCFELSEFSADDAVAAMAHHDTEAVAADMGRAVAGFRARLWSIVGVLRTVAATDR